MRREDALCRLIPLPALKEAVLKRRVPNCLLIAGRCYAPPAPMPMPSAKRMKRGDLWAPKTVEMTPEEHDSIFGLISHLPHLLSYALVEMIEKRGDDGLRYAAGGFRDFTRIAGSHPDMWRDIFSVQRR